MKDIAFSGDVQARKEKLLILIHQKLENNKQKCLYELSEFIKQDVSFYIAFWPQLAS